jgi:hypothetical protein
MAIAILQLTFPESQASSHMLTHFPQLQTHLHPPNCVWLSLDTFVDFSFEKFTKNAFYEHALKFLQIVSSELLFIHNLL